MLVVLFHIQVLNLKSLFVKLGVLPPAPAHPWTQYFISIINGERFFSLYDDIYVIDLSTLGDSISLKYSENSLFQMS